MTYTLILPLRHGESDWNAKNLFTGWVDVGLTEKGQQEAVRGGEQLREADLLPDVVHLGAASGDQHRLHLPRRRGPALDPGPPLHGASTSVTTAR